ncbi:MAG: glucose-6-phosphate isomerase [Alphaproteobacteria bacterium]
MIYSATRALSDPKTLFNYQSALDQCSEGLLKIKKWYDEGSLPLLRLPEERDDLKKVEEFAVKVGRDFDDFIVLGTGGSNLGAKTLFSLNHKGLNQATSGIRCHFFDNVDPSTFKALMESFTPSRTFIFSVSKSGTTAETMSQTVLLMDWLLLAGCDLRTHVAVLTEPKASPLTSLAERFGLQAFSHDPLVGGRFSVFSIVGLIPAMVAGIDPIQVREGAWSVLGPVINGAKPEDVTAAQGAALAAAHVKAGRSQTVLLPYADQLADFGLWYRQLWAESVGKEGLGTTPIRAMGTIDQHSQLQLYLDGPADKLFTFIEVAQSSILPALNPDLLDDKLSYLKGQSLGDLLVAECRASADTLAAKGHPVREIKVDEVSGYTMGALMMHFVLETILAAHLWNIDAFNQPAVEDIKIRTRQVLAGQE